MISTSINDIRDLDSLIAALADNQRLTRLRARDALVAIGQPAVWPLVKALEHPDWRIRWEAAMALTQIGDPSASSGLVNALEDEHPGVRWLAAEALTVLTPAGLRAVLEALVHRSDSAWLREGAHHIIHLVMDRDPELRDVLAPVAAALNDIEPVIQVPPAAEAALRRLTDEL